MPARPPWRRWRVVSSRSCCFGTYVQRYSCCGGAAGALLCKRSVFVIIVKYLLPVTKVTSDTVTLHNIVNGRLSPYPHIAFRFPHVVLTT